MMPRMDWKLELITVPVSDVDRAKAFYTDRVGFNADHDHTVSDDLRFVQLTPPGSACSIAIGTGLTQMAPGSLQNIQMVVLCDGQRRRGREARFHLRRCSSPMIGSALAPHCS
jgi:catechol 2,3-dioxygenase-like lactoylglutathione lyase family enzyme